jgi:hypothetical protein
MFSSLLEQWPCYLTMWIAPFCVWPPTESHIVIVPHPIAPTWQYIMCDTSLFHSLLHLFTIPSFLTLSAPFCSSHLLLLAFISLVRQLRPFAFVNTSEQLSWVFRSAYKMEVREWRPPRESSAGGTVTDMKMIRSVGLSVPHRKLITSTSPTG